MPVGLSIGASSGGSVPLCGGRGHVGLPLGSRRPQGSRLLRVKVWVLVPVGLLLGLLRAEGNLVPSGFNSVALVARWPL